MKWFRHLFQKRELPTWSYFGCVTATTRLVNGDGNDVPGGTMRGDYLLEERSDGKRRYKLVGTPGHSQDANYRLACVEAWVMGAEIPDKILGDKTRTKTETKKKSADLIVFPGGKE